MAVCVCEMLSDIGYFCLKVKTVVKKIGYFWAISTRLPKHSDSLSGRWKHTEEWKIENSAGAMKSVMKKIIL